jgi:putative effector of murein hydrolase LrgA (UPF0299 family)
MNIKEALFSSTETLKAKTRKEIRLWLWPMISLEYILAFFLPIFFTIETYYREVETEFKLSAVAYILSGVLLLLMYGRLRKGLAEWQTNKRMKWTMLTAIKFIPIIAIAFILYVISTNTMVFMNVMNKVVISYSISMILNMYTSPLRTELQVRDKIRLNTEQNRVID